MEDSDSNETKLSQSLSQNQSQNPINNWLHATLALSLQSCRFTLPIDMKDFEKMTPMEYLVNYCVLSPRRRNLYCRIFLKHKDTKTQTILYKDLSNALMEVLVNTLTPELIKELYKMLCIKRTTVVDCKVFSGILAFAERKLFPKFVTRCTAKIPSFQRDLIECADFHCLDWKLKGVCPNPKVITILKTLGST